MSSQSAEVLDYCTEQYDKKYSPVLDAVGKGTSDSVIRLVDGFFSPSLNFLNSYAEELRKPELPEPANQTDSEALYRGVISFGDNKSVEFQSLQKWEGIVQQIHNDYFVAKLIDLTNKLPDEIAEFPIEEISEDDKRLVELGAVFYWNIGYQISKSKQKRRTSLIRFRRLVAWSEKDLQRGKMISDSISALLGLK